MITNKFLPVMLFSLLLAACGGAVTQENYEKIRNDMSADEVNQILGEPTEVSSFGVGSLSATTSKWVGDTHTIVVAFANDKVKMKTYTRNEKEPRSNK
jgi:outer membrane protein assembly factor BamE (lipoprotein component of BamABCDE complex)